MGNKKIYVGMGIVFVVVLLFMVRPSGASYEALDEFEGVVEFHKSMSCGCCGLHANYLSSKGGLDIDVMVMNDVGVAKDRHEIRKVNLDESLMSDDKEMIEDLLAAAVNDAVRRLEQQSKEKMSGLTEGLSLPGGMKLPF